MEVAVGADARPLQSSSGPHIITPPISPLESRVRVLNTLSEKHTFVGVACPSRDGLMVELLGTLVCEYNLRIITSEYKEQNAQAVATFSCTTSYGTKLEQHKVGGLERALYDVLAGDQINFNYELDAKSKTHTIVDVVGKDRPGVLHDVTRALSFLGLQVDSAKVFSHKGRMLDIFFITDNGRKIDDPNKLLRVHEVIKAAMRDAEAKITVSGDLQSCMLKREEEELQRIKRSRMVDPGTPPAPAPASDADVPDIPSPASSASDDNSFVFPEQETHKVQVSFEADPASRDSTIIKIVCKNHASLLYDLALLFTDLGVHLLRARLTAVNASSPTGAAAPAPVPPVPAVVPSNESGSGGGGEAIMRDVQIELLLADTNGTLPPFLAHNQMRTMKRLIIGTVVNPSQDSDQHSVVEVFAPDRPNLLRDVAEALRKLGVQVKQARVSTHNGRIKDVFCITDANGRKIQSETMMAHIYSVVVGAMMG